MVDLHQLRDALLENVSALGYTPRSDAETVTIRYPVQQYPEKVKSLDIEKLGTIEGKLWGIKGQYLIFDVGVINVRKYTGYTWRVQSTTN